VTVVSAGKTGSTCSSQCLINGFYQSTWNWRLDRKGTKVLFGVGVGAVTVIQWNADPPSDLILQESHCNETSKLLYNNYMSSYSSAQPPVHLPATPYSSLLLRRASHSSVQLCTAPYSFVQLRVSSICIDDHSNRLWLVKPESNHSRAALNLLLIKLRAKQVSIWWVSMTSRRVFVIPIRYTARREFAWC